MVTAPGTQRLLAVMVHGTTVPPILLQGNRIFCGHCKVRHAPVGQLVRMVMVKERLVSLPQASRAVHWTRWSPMVKKLPELGTQVTVALVLHEFVAAMVKSTVRPPGQVQSRTMFDGKAVNTGGVSNTSTSCVQITLGLLQQSVACHRPARIIRHGVESKVTGASWVTVTFVPQQLSKALGGSKTNGSPHRIVLLVGQ